MMKWFVVFTLLVSLQLQAKQTINVGVYDFPPYVFMYEKPKGLSIRVLKELNEFQDEFHFVAIPTTPRRRFKDFKSGKFDMLIFEDKSWGWEHEDIDVSKPFVSDVEVFITLANEAKSEDFFEDFTDKIIVGVMGYHYQFADFNSDPNYLKRRFNFVPSHDQNDSVELILKERGDIAIVSKSFLTHLFLNTPELKTKLLVSNRTDQVYRHTVLLRKDKPLNIHHLEKLLLDLKPRLQPIWKSYGLVELN